MKSKVRRLDKAIEGNWKLCKEIVFEYDKINPFEHNEIVEDTARQLSKKYKHFHLKTSLVQWNVNNNGISRNYEKFRQLSRNPPPKCGYLWTFPRSISGPHDKNDFL